MVQVLEEVVQALEEARATDLEQELLERVAMLKMMKVFGLMSMMKKQSGLTLVHLVLASW